MTLAGLFTGLTASGLIFDSMAHRFFCKYLYTFKPRSQVDKSKGRKKKIHCEIKSMRDVFASP